MQAPVNQGKTRRRSGLGLLLALLLVLGLLVWQWDAVRILSLNLGARFATPQHLVGLDTPARVLAFVEQHQADVALVSYSVDPGGAPLDDGRAIAHNADAPMPLASTMKMVVLAAYAQQVERGALDPDEPVAVADWERFYLPGTDGGAHAEALSELGLAADARGFARDPSATVTLDQLARAMIRHSDNAATDYLLQRVGPDSVRHVLVAGGLGGHEPVLPLLGTFLSWQNHEQPEQRGDRLAALDALAPADYAALVEQLAQAYQEPAWRAAELAWRERRPPRDIAFAQQAGRHLLPQGTARDYARIMAGVVTGTFLSPGVSATMRRHLEWPLEQPGHRERFAAFGRKGGAWAGVRTSASFYIPRTGELAGQPRVVVLFMRDLPHAAWERLGATGGNLRFTNALADDPAFAAQVREALAATDAPTARAGQSHLDAHEANPGGTGALWRINAPERDDGKAM